MFDGEPCGTVWLNLPDREDCPRCGSTLDYLRVDDDLKCREHRDADLVDEDLEYCIRAMEPMFNREGYKLVRFCGAHPFLEAAAARPIPPVGKVADLYEWDRTRAVNIEGPQA